MLAIIGYGIILLMMLLILKNKALPVLCFTILPIIGAFLCGFTLEEVSGFISQGVGTTWSTAILFIFSVVYFGVMNDAGLFDKLVDNVLKLAGNNISLIMLAVAIIAVVGHLDGATASTYLITIPVMLPIFKRMNLRPLVMLLIISAATGVMNLVPWGGPTIRAATAIGMDATEMWVRMIPMQIFGLVITLGMAFYLGRVEQKRLSLAGITFGTQGSIDLSSASSDEANDSQELKRPWMFIFNLLLTILVIFSLIKALLPTYMIFLIGLIIALAVNYPDIKLQQTLIQKHAPGAIMLVVTLIGAGVFLGIFVNSGMITEMANVLIRLLPDTLQKYLHIITGALGAPLGMIMGPDPYYYGVLPLISETVAGFGVTPEQVAYAMLIGENVALAVSPCVPTTFLAVGLAGVDLPEHIKFSFKWLWLISVVMLVFAILIGIV